MRIVVTGSREWDNIDLLADTLNDLHNRYSIAALFHGDNPHGADKMSKDWAIANGVAVFGCPYASRYGSRGGTVRNGWLLDFGLPDLVVAFPTPSSVGTWNCVTQARQRHLRIRIVKDPRHAAL